MPEAVDFKRARPSRKQRVADLVAPLVLAGKSTRAIARELGISQKTADRDVRLAHALWKETLQDAGERWQAQAVVKYEYILAELQDQWERMRDGKITQITNPDGSTVIKREPADLKPLAAMVSTMKELTTLLGIRQADTVQQVSIESTTISALAPLTEDGYAKLIAGGAPSVTAQPPRPQVIDVEDTGGG